MEIIKVGFEPETITFEQLKPGECFASANFGGVFLKVEPPDGNTFNTIVIEPFPNDDCATQAWRPTYFGSITEIVPLSGHLTVQPKRNESVSIGPVAVEINARDGKVDLESLRTIAAKSGASKWVGSVPSKLEAHYERESKTTAVSLSGDPLLDSDPNRGSINDYPGNVHGLGCLCGLCTGAR